MTRIGGRSDQKLMLPGPGSIAVVVVDVQNDFCSPGRVPNLSEMLTKLAFFTATMRDLGAKIIFTKSIHSEETDSEIWLSRHVDRPERQGICREGSLGAEFHPSIKPEPDDSVILKNRYNAFLGTNLELLLRARRLEYLCFAGLTSDTCVETTAREAFQRDFWTILVSDCMATRSEEAHQGTLERAERGFAHVATSEQVINAVSASS